MAAVGTLGSIWCSAEKKVRMLWEVLRPGMKPDWSGSASDVIKGRRRLAISDQLRQNFPVDVYEGQGPVGVTSRLVFVRFERGNDNRLSHGRR